MHDAPATSLVIIPNSSDEDDASRLIATTSHDLTARLTRVALSSSSAKTVASLHLHTAPLTSVCSNASGSRLLTTSVDGMIGLWDTVVPKNDEVPSDDVQGGGVRKKRRKVGDDQETRPKRKAPIAVLKSHTARVSKAVFIPTKSESAVSVGFDSTIRTWDTEHGVCTSTIVSNVSHWQSVLLLTALPRLLRQSLSWMLHLFPLERLSWPPLLTVPSAITTCASASLQQRQHH